MELTDLAHEERLALVGLLRWVATADHVLTDAERACLEALRGVFGDDRWKLLLREAQLVFKQPEHLQRFCEAQVRRGDARRLIYREVTRMAGANGWDADDVRTLNWIGIAWGLVDPAAIEGADADFDLEDYDHDSDELDLDDLDDLDDSEGP